MKNILSELKKRVLIYDGAMGTMLQRQGLVPGACPEEWNLSHPEKVLAVHKAYVSAKADIVETNTFGGNRLSLEKYGLAEKCYEINYHGVNLAKQAGVFVAASIGPLPEMISPLGKLMFNDALEVYKEQIKALSSAEPDLIILETFSDIKELKIAVIAAKEVCDLPIQAQLTYTESGVTLSGTPPEVAVVILEALGVEIIGANCSLGPKELFSIIKRMEKAAKPETYISVLPNAGMPALVNGKTVYNISPDVIAKYAKEYYKSGVNLIGGCCGTTPEHIKAIAKAVRNKKPATRKDNKIFLKAASRTKVVELLPEKAPYIIGERINPTRKKDLVDELCLKKSILIRSEAQNQISAGANLIDVNVSVPGIDEPSTIRWVVESVEQAVDVPLVIDSSNPKAIEEGLKQYAGKPIVNSVNGEKKKMEDIFPLVKKYGASVIALAMDEKGIPETVEKRIQIAERILKEAQKYGIDKEDIVLDFLTLTAGANPENARITLDCVKEAKKRKWQTVLGVSNVSFGLPNRPSINKAFLDLAVKNGLTSAIINPRDLSAEVDASAVKMLFGKHDFKKIEEGRFKKAEKVISTEKKEKIDPLYKCILTGDKDNILDYIEKYLKEKKDPLEINQKILIPALTEVGRRFERKEYFLPQLLLSAEAMRKAVDRLEKAFPKGTKKQGASIILATVKGDMHDIGKNIVSSVFKNFGFNVIDMGKDVSHEDIIETVTERKVDIIGLSALMTTTMGQMEVVINELKKRNINIPTIIGGAVVTDNYAKKIGAAGYARDAISAVNEVKRILKK